MGKLADAILQLVITNVPEGKNVFYVSESNSTFQTLGKKEKKKKSISCEPNKQYNESDAETIRREYALYWLEKQASTMSSLTFKLDK